MDKLLDMIKSNVTNTQVILSSGQPSNVYIDLRKLASTPVGINELSKRVNELIRHFDVNSIGGLESGAIPICTTVSMISRLNSFYVRKLPKEHGLQKSIEGSPESPVLVFDDVVNTGESLVKVIDALRPEYKVKAAICIVYRGSDKDTLEKRLGCKLYSLYTLDDLL